MGSITTIILFSMDCIFCKIVAGDIPSYTVYSDGSAVAFLDIFPHAKGHTVVIHKEHAPRVEDTTEQALAQVMLAVKKSMEKIQTALAPDGFNVGINDGVVAGQAVPHLHIHILPRWKNDGGGSVHSIIKNSGSEKVADVFKLFN